jgi:hypothetical protein
MQRVIAMCLALFALFTREPLELTSFRPLGHAAGQITSLDGSNALLDKAME